MLSTAVSYASRLGKGVGMCCMPRTIQRGDAGTETVMARWSLQIEARQGVRGRVRSSCPGCIAYRLTKVAGGASAGRWLKAAPLTLAVPWL